MTNTLIVRPDGVKIDITYKGNIRSYIKEDIDKFYIGSGWYTFWAHEDGSHCQAYIYDKKFIGCFQSKSEYYCELDQQYYSTKKQIEKMAVVGCFL